jgi:hypothetical protein
MAVQPAEEAEDQGGSRRRRSHGPIAQQLLLPGDGEGEGEGDGEGRPQQRTESTRRRRKLKEKRKKKKKKKIYVEMCVWDRFVD